MTNPKEKRETLKKRFNGVRSGAQSPEAYKFTNAKKLVAFIKAEIKQAFEETRGELRTSPNPLKVDLVHNKYERDMMIFNKGHNQALQETIKRQEDYLNNL